MFVKGTEMQDSEGNIYYPHTDASVVKIGDSNVQITYNELYNSLQELSDNDSKGINNLAVTKASHVEGITNLSSNGVIYNFSNYDVNTKTLTLDNTIGLVVGGLLDIKVLDKQALSQVQITNITGNQITIDVPDDTIVSMGVVKRNIIQKATHAEGSNTISSGDDSHSEGTKTQASGDQSHAEGKGTIASGNYSHAEGYITKSSGVSSHAEGDTTIASGNYSHVEGKYTSASGNYSHAECYATKSSGSNSHAEGANSTASGITSHAEGESTLASGLNSHAEGFKTQANSDQSHAEGSNTSSEGNNAHSEGYSTHAIGNNSHAECYGTKATGINSHAEGYGTEASGINAHAEGQRTMASGDNSHAEGNNTRANGNSSHAEGTDTKASGDCSHAEGSNTKASGVSSHAEGDTTIASGNYSHAEGISTVAKYAQHVMGQYNTISSASDTSYSASSEAFIIGNGINTSRRGNAFKVLFNGSTYAGGAYSSTGADYAEYFEWVDGNPNNEDRVGIFVTLEGDKIRKATSQDDYILGIVSATPSVVGDNYEAWKDKYITDDFGRIQYHEVLIPAESHIIHHNPVYENIDPESIDPSNQIVVSEAYDEKVIDNPERIEIQPIYNPEWISTKEYISREHRKEWSAIGMMGKLLVMDDGTCVVNGYCKPNDEGMATKCDRTSDIHYRVTKRINDHLVQVILK